MKRTLMIVFSDDCQYLTLTKSSFIWTDTIKKATIQLKNTGEKNIESLTVYFNADKETVSQSIHPQISHDIKALKKGASVDLTADFSLLAVTHNDFLEDVSKISIFIESQINCEKIIPLNTSKSKKNNALSESAQIA